MNPYTFLFVTCVNDEKLYHTCVRYIQKLRVPPHCNVQLLPIRYAKSMAEGYNQALLNHAKYKIYLHQDTFILNTNLLWDLLALFQANPSLGLLGVAGCKVLPPNGIWWEGEPVGKVFRSYGSHFELAKFKEADPPFEPVECVDGLFMATQYDLRWREDLFDGFHFYDASQSLEFRKHGYLVGVSSQAEPWCLHYRKHGSSVIKNNFEHYRQIFLNHYKI